MVDYNADDCGGVAVFVSGDGVADSSEVGSVLDGEGHEDRRVPAYAIEERPDLRRRFTHDAVNKNFT